MKKLIFALLMTVGTLSFASANVESSEKVFLMDESSICYSIGSIEFDASKADLEKLAKFEEEYGSVDTYFGDSFIGWTCGETPGDILDTLLELFF